MKTKYYNIVCLEIRYFSKNPSILFENIRIFKETINILLLFSNVKNFKIKKKLIKKNDFLKNKSISINRGCLKNIHMFFWGISQKILI